MLLQESQAEHTVLMNKGSHLSETFVMRSLQAQLQRDVLKFKDALNDLASLLWPTV